MNARAVLASALCTAALIAVPLGAVAWARWHTFADGWSARIHSALCRRAQQELYVAVVDEVITADRPAE